MTGIEVECGPCGFKALIRAQSDAEGRVSLELESECPALRQLAGKLGPVDPYTDGRTFFTSSVYQAADACLKHVDCAIPAVLVRAVHVEAGLALPYEISMRIIKE